MMERLGMARALATMLCTALLACSSKPEAPVTQDSSRNRRGIHNPERSAEDNAPEQPTAKPRARPMPVRALAPSKAEPEAPSQEEAQEEVPERDLGKELVAAVGSPATCMEPRQSGSAPPEVSVSLEAVVTENGIVTRSDARSSQLNANELACIKARLSSTRLRAPIDAAPRTVAATVTLKLSAAPAPTP